MGSMSVDRNGTVGAWQSFLYHLYDTLTKSDPIRPVDLIFVIAGRIERKQYGLELYRSGLAPRLILSVGRFEVSKMAATDFRSVDQLIAERNQTPPDERHFFCEINGDKTRIEKVRLPRWNTYGELLGLRQYLERDMPRHLMIISTDVHLRRISLAFTRIFRGLPVEVHYCPVPSSASSVAKRHWWVGSTNRDFVLREMMKFIGYLMIVNMPNWVVRSAMRLNA